MTDEPVPPKMTKREERIARAWFALEYPHSPWGRWGKWSAVIGAFLAGMRSGKSPVLVPPLRSTSDPKHSVACNRLRGHPEFKSVEQLSTHEIKTARACPACRAGKMRG